MAQAGGKYSEAFIAEVRGRTSLIGLVREAVILQVRGRDAVGLCPFHQERTPSFHVHEDKGFYHCFGCDAHGDAFNFLCEYAGLRFPEAVEELAARAGMLADSAGHRRPLQPVVQRKVAADPVREKQDAIQWSRNVWASSELGKGTAVERYLAGRGIAFSRMGGFPPSLRFHKGLKHVESGKYWPAMVAAVQGEERKIYGLHRTFLQVDKLNAVKAPISPVKKMSGLCAGGSVRFARADTVLAIAEGIETALSIMQATGMPSWAALSLNNMGRVLLPDSVETVILCADADMKDADACNRMMTAAAAEHYHQGRKVHIAWPEPGKDFNDMLREAGV